MVSQKPKNIILLIGDGMGLSQVAAMSYTAKGLSPFELFPHLGFVKTHSADSWVTDSAAGATAMACGTKTYNNAIGMTRDTQPCKNLYEYAEEQGLGTGIVVSSSITHATPAAFVAHQPLRALQEQIAADYLALDIDCIIGGGLVYFTTRFSDRRDLIEEFEAKGYTVETFQRKYLSRLKLDDVEKLVYFTAFTEPAPNHIGREYLPGATELAAGFLKERFPEGFILLVEGSQIDYAGHAKDVQYMLNEMEDFSAAIDKAMKFAANDGETLVLVTADHSTGALTIQDGNPSRMARFKFLANYHTEEMVPIFGYGPGSEMFQGIMDNTDIFHKIKLLLSL